MNGTPTDLCSLTIEQASVLLRNRKVSPLELTRTFLARIETLDPTLNAYITVTPERALADARAAESDIMRGAYRGPLHGIPVAHKDLFDTAGIRTTASSRALSDRVPAEDATAVARLQAAGVVLLGKLAMHEFALGGPDATCGFPLARNPWSLDHIPGGSSSGSATAVAAALCMASLGTCAGGSVRGPAAHCSIVGLKPTYGVVSRRGVLPGSFSLDHCGPMTRTVEDAALVLQHIAGHDPGDPTSVRVAVPDYTAALRSGVRGMRIGVARHFFFADSPRIDQQLVACADGALRTLAGLGATIVDVQLPTLHYADAAQSVIMLSEVFAAHESTLARDLPQFGDMLRSRFTMTALFRSMDYVQAQRVRRRLNREFARVLEEVDVLVSPTMSQPPPTFASIDAMTNFRMLSFTAPYNLTGMPAISVPAGFTSAGLPVGVQIAGRAFDEATVLRTAYAYEQAAGWYERRPLL